MFYRSSELASVLPSTDQPNSELARLFTKDDLLLTEYDKYSLGKSYFDSKEFSRAAHHLKACKSQPAMFLYYYSRYMVCTLLLLLSEVFDTVIFIHTQVFDTVIFIHTQVFDTVIFIHTQIQYSTFI